VSQPVGSYLRIDVKRGYILPGSVYKGTAYTTGIPQIIGIGHKYQSGIFFPGVTEAAIRRVIIDKYYLIVGICLF
jgi:hypothetical protein